MSAVQFEPSLHAHSTRGLRDSALQESRRPDLAPVSTVPVALLLPGDSPRLSGESLEHAHALAASDEELPPILVHRPTMRVIDGMHRLRVALLRGREEIQVRFFDGSETDAFVLAVKANIGHGLPLTLADRLNAAERILVSHANWSDRIIASATGLSATTVGSLRRRKTDMGAAPAARLGRDGKVRPLSTAEGRRTAGRLITASPDAPLREIAQQANISLGTVRDVRNRILRGEDPVPDPHRTASRRKKEKPAKSQENHVSGQTGHHKNDSAPDPLPDTPKGKSPSGGTATDLVVLFQHLSGDPSLRYTETGRLLLRMLQTQIAGVRRWDEIAESVPSHRAEMVSAAAAECACAWQKLARKILQRTPAP